MNIPKTTRIFFADEQRILKFLLAKTKKELKTKSEYYYFLIVSAIIITTACTYIAIVTKSDFLLFVFGTMAVLGSFIAIFVPYEIYKDLKRAKNIILTLEYFIYKGSVDVYQIRATKIALAPEYDDESDLYIIEFDKNKVLYLWDTAYNLHKKFPCLNFEIYEDKFFKLTGRQIYPLSKKIQPIKIDKQAKWNYMEKYGVFGHLEIEHIDFNELMEKYRYCA